MNTRHHSPLAAVLLVLGLFAAACADSAELTAEPSADASIASDPTDDPVAQADGADFDVDTLEIMTRWPEGTAEAEALAVATTRFTEQTGVTVDIIGEGGEDLDVAYETAVLGGSEPHLIFINLFDKTIAWIDNGVSVDVAPYLDEWGLRDTLDPLTIEEWTKGDQVQGFPYSGFAWPVLYNTALLTEAGVAEIPTTTKELIDVAQQLRSAGIAPVVVGGSDWSGQKLFMQIAQDYLDAETTTTLLGEGGWCDNPDARQGIW